MKAVVVLLKLVVDPSDWLVFQTNRQYVHTYLYPPSHSDPYTHTYATYSHVRGLVGTMYSITLMPGVAGRAIHTESSSHSLSQKFNSVQLTMHACRSVGTYNVFQGTRLCVCLCLTEKRGKVYHSLLATVEA